MKASALFKVTAFLLFWAAPAFSQHMHHELGKEELAADTSGVAKEVYRCPMHPEVAADKPGRCPKCGMKLERVTPKAATDTTYTKHSLAPDSGDNMGKEKLAADTSGVAREVHRCPMHPEVIADKPGKCPKCGMKLERVSPKSALDTTQTKQ